MRYIPDIVSVDCNDRPVLIGEVRAPRTIAPDQVADILQKLKAARSAMPAGAGVRYGLIADPREIRLYDLDAEAASPVWSARTLDVMKPYAPDFPGNTGVGDRVFRWYLEGMIGSWLRDLVYDWKKLEARPGREEFERIGLLERMKGGWSGALDRMQLGGAGREVPLGSDALR